MVMFTGSTATGKKVMARAAETLTPVSLELGGKDPMIVLADADVERAANAAAYYSMQNARPDLHLGRARLRRGAGLRRVRRQASRARSRRCARASRRGPGTVDVGAITFPPQLDIVEPPRRRTPRRPARACSPAARAPHGRRPLLRADRARRRRPHDDVHDRGDVRPDLPIMKVADADEAVRLANDSQYGLAASVWTKDAARGEEIARRIEAGVGRASTTRSSTTSRSSCRWAAGRRPASASRHGAGGIRKYCRQQSLLVTRFAPPERDLHVLPLPGAHDEADRQGREAALRPRQARLAPRSGRPSSASISRRSRRRPRCCRPWTASSERPDAARRPRAARARSGSAARSRRAARRGSASSASRRSAKRSRPATSSARRRRERTSSHGIGAARAHVVDRRVVRDAQDPGGERHLTRGS